MIGQLDSTPYHAIDILTWLCVIFSVRHNIDLEHAVQMKHAYNVKRPMRHGKAF